MPAAAPVARIISSVARDAADLLALPGSGYTVQLAATRSVAGLTALRQKLGIAVEDTFVIRVRRDNQDWWLMLWRDFPDLSSARSAAATLSAHGSFWPRRLAPLQGEVRATPN
jgi:septal ring-binding cell division protein DamX